jgi:predicted AlkP superfamily pyrophosphatase or phosphodiesterase
MKKIFCSLLFLLLAAPQFAQQAASKTPQTPKLVVGLVVDQMRYDYIYRFWNKFGNDGFKRLLGEGYFCRNVNYNYVPTYTGPGHASIYTGTTPAVHGIISNDWYARATGKDMYCVDDPMVKGVGSNEPEGKRSPENLLTSTITDQLRLATNMQSKVIGVALKDRSSILPAGHTGQAYWYEGKTGNFITSTYYRNELPAWAIDFNKQQNAQKYLKQDWNTILPVEQYTESLADDNAFEGRFRGEERPVFPHHLAQLMEANGQLGLIRSTPFGTSFTFDFAMAAIKGENMGKGSVTDFAAISLSSPDYVGHMYGPQSVEMEDTYIRLDKDLAAFLKFLDGWIGKNNVLVFLTADHGVVEVPEYLKSIRIPAGYFKEEVVTDSLKKILKAKYGDTLVLSYSNDQVFLNNLLIQQKGWNKADIENFIADFFLGFKGVSEVVTATALRNTQFTAGARRNVQNGWHARMSGDVCVILSPGWFADMGRKTGTTHGAPWSYDTHVPLLWYGWNVDKGSCDNAYDIVDIAPTLAMMLNIQFPNGCTGKPITGITR